MRSRGPRVRGTSLKRTCPPPVRSPSNLPPARPLSRPPRWRRGLLALALCGLAACAPRDRQGTQAPEAQAPTFSDAPVLGAIERLTLPAGASRAQRLSRLDRLLDLFDAARFGDDADARESFWLSLGGSARGRGQEATREAALRLLDEALRLEEEPDLDADERDLVASAILLLTTDLHPPALAEDLSIRTAAYRELIDTGHPRVADNARWRIYDHLRGCLDGSIAAPPERRPEIAVHALYARDESIAEHLDDRAIHARPPLPPPAALLDLFDQIRAALRVDPRWAPVIARRADADERLRATALATLPAPRDPNWDIPRMPAGVGRLEHLAPIIRLDGDDLLIDEGRPAAKRSPYSAPAAPSIIEGALAQDGRGVVLYVAPSRLPSPALHGSLRALLAARVAQLDLAIREPRVEEDRGDVILSLPLEVVRDADLGPGAQAIRKARIHVHLDGRGPRVAIDGRLLAARPASERELVDLLGSLDRAYPREHMVTLSLGDDVLYQQLIDLLRALIGGPQRHYEVVGWLVDRELSALTAPSPADAEDRRLRLRAALFPENASATLDQPYPLPSADQPRLEALARALPRCLPEAEAPLGGPLRLRLRFEEGRLAAVDAPKARPSEARLRKEPSERVIACVHEEARGFRLRDHRDPIAIDLLLR